MSYQMSAAQIVRAYRDILATPDQPAAVMSDSRGVQCYISMFKDAV